MGMKEYVIALLKENIADYHKRHSHEDSLLEEHIVKDLEKKIVELAVLSEFTDRVTVPKVDWRGWLIHHLGGLFHDLGEVFKDWEEGRPVDDVEDIEGSFTNWGQTVKNKPGQIRFLKKVSDLCDFVKEAKEQNVQIRASGFRHTWTNLFTEDGGYLFSMVPSDQLTLPFFFFPGSLDPENEFQKIELLEKKNDGEKALFKIGAATTCEQFRQWVNNQVNSKREDLYTFPMDVIMKHITYGGSNAPICHGAGLKNATLSDLVREIEFVDPSGEVQTVNDPDQIKAAAGCFGMLGIVTAITFELDRLTYANVHPQKVPLVEAIPPPLEEHFEIPDKYKQQWKNKKDSEKDKIYKDFAHAIENNYYAEWFWFVGTPDAVVNVWNADKDASDEDAVYPTWGENVCEYLQEFMGEVMTQVWKCMEECKLFREKISKFQAHVTGHLGLLAMSTRSFQTPLINALHFRNGVQNMRVRDMEWEIPIPQKKSSILK